MSISISIKLTHIDKLPLLEEKLNWL